MVGRFHWKSTFLFKHLPSSPGLLFLWPPPSTLPQDINRKKKEEKSKEHPEVQN